MHAQSHVTVAKESALLAAVPVRSRAATMRDAAAPEAMTCGPGAHPRGFDLARIPIAPLQRKATISSPGDAFEREADDVADKVMRMADTPAPTAAPPAIQRKCASCEDEEKHIHTKRATPAVPDTSLDTSAAVHAAAGGGAPLSHDVRSYFEPRFGRDFSQVRVHTDGAAANAARSVQARAYTLGRDIVFGSGAYAPASSAGRRLIAHELTHVVQQGGRAGRMQRKLSVDEKASDDPKTAVSTIDTLIKSLCPDFEVAKGGLVTPKKGSDCAGFKFAKIAKGKQPLGCCCLCTMTAAPAAWRIVVSAKDAPTTDSVKREVRMTPTSGLGAPDSALLDCRAQGNGEAATSGRSVRSRVVRTRGADADRRASIEPYLDTGSCIQRRARSDRAYPGRACEGNGEPGRSRTRGRRHAPRRIAARVLDRSIRR